MKTGRFFSMAALVAMGAILASCVKEETPEVVEPAADIHDGGKSATLTFTLVNPKPSGFITATYPASMTDDTGGRNLSKLDTQDGTLESLAANLDLATFWGNMDGLELPSMVSIYENS